MIFLKTKIIFICAFLVIIAIYFLLDKKSIQTSKEIEFSLCNYYQKENLNRYLEYQRLNKNLKPQTVVNYVNMNLDYPFYSHIKKTTITDYHTLVNKYLKLEENYVPNDLEIVNKKYNPNSLKLRKEAKENRESSN